MPTLTRLIPQGFISKTQLKTVLLATLIGSSSSVFSADVLVSRIVDHQDPVDRGGDITYDIDVSNSAADAANDVTLSVPIPVNTQFVSVDDSDCSHNTGTLSCNFGTLAGSGLRTIELAIRTTADTLNTVIIEASAGTSSADTNPANDNSTHNTTVDDGADLQTTLTATPASVIAGGNIRYTATVDNLGPNTANGISLNFALSTNVSFISGSISNNAWSCTPSGQQLQCSYSSGIALSGSSSFNFDVQVTGAQLGNISSDVTSNTTTGDPVSANDFDSASTTVTSGTDIAISIASHLSSEISAQAMNFVLQPRNLGPHTAADVEVNFTIDTGFTISSAPTGNGWACTITNPGNTAAQCLRASYGVGAANNISVPVVTASPLALTNYNLTTDISSSTPEALNRQSNNSDNSSISITPDGVDLSISKSKSVASDGVSSTNPVAVGESMYSRIVVSNAGPRNAADTDFSVTDSLDISKVDYRGFTGSNWTCSYTAPDVSCNYTGIINSGSSSSNLIIETEATAPGTITNTAVVAYTGNPGDYDNSNDSRDASINSTGDQIDLAVTKATHTTSEGVGDHILTTNEESVYYTIVITNALSSSVPATGILLSDTMPAYYSGSGLTTNVQVTTAPANYDCSGSSNALVSCTQTSGSLAAGASDTFVIKVDRPLLPGNYTNRASAYSTTIGDSDRSNNIGTSLLEVASAVDIQLQSKTVNPGSTEAGAYASYSISVLNRGPAIAAGVELTDVFDIPVGDTGFTFISFDAPGIGDHTSASPACTGLTVGNSYTSTDTPTLVCDLGDLNANQTQVVNLRIRPNFLNGQTTDRVFNNSASVSTTTFEKASDQANNIFGPVPLTIIKDKIDLLIEVIDNVDPFIWDQTNNGDNPQNDIIYDVAFKNLGPSYATGVYYDYIITPKTGKTLEFKCDEANSGDSCGTSTDTCQIHAGSNPVTGPATLTLRCDANTETGKTNEMDVDSVTGGHRYVHIRSLSKPDTGGDTHLHEVTIAANEEESLALNNVETEQTSTRGHTDIEITEKAANLPEVDLEQPFNWTITLINNGPIDSVNTQLTDSLASDMSLNGNVSWRIAGGSNGQCDVSGGDISCDIGLLASGKTATVTVPVTVPSFTLAQLQNCASATTDGTDPDATNNTNICGTIDVNNKIYVPPIPPQEIPALAPWALISLSGLMGLMGLYRRKA